MEPVEITGVAHGGHGVARIDGRVCFVAYGLPGDVVHIHIERETRGVLWASIESIAQPGPSRIETHAVGCSYFGKCGGCTWLHFSYPAQSEWKRQIVRDAFARIAKIEVEPTWIEDPAFRLGYRTRAKFFAKGKTRGFYAERTHEIVDIEACPLCHPHLNQALQQLRAIGSTATAEITVNPEGGEVLVWLDRADSRVLANFKHTGWKEGKGRPSSFQFDGVPIVNGAFSQSSLILNRLLRSDVHARIEGAERVLDLYCGSGNLSATLGPNVFVHGIDSNAAAIDAANRVRPRSYRKGREDDFKSSLSGETWDVVLLDPPRTGAKAIMESLAAARTGQIVYVSCDPATLARDAAALCQHGWTIGPVSAIDMFPQTAHVECVTSFLRLPNA